MTKRVASRFSPLILGTLVLGAGCIDTPNGSTFSGNNVGRVVHLTGFALSPGDTVTVEVLGNANLDPDTSTSWYAIGTTSASTNPVYWAGDNLYPFAIDVTPVSSIYVVNRWPGGGLVRLRAKNSDGNFLQTFDDTDCYGEALGDGKDFGQIYTECKSHDTPVLTFVDVDPVPPHDPNKPYLSLRKNAADPAVAAAEAAQYNTQIGAPATLGTWKTTRGFPGGKIVTRYYNRGDLGIGREMHCRSGSVLPGLYPDVSCYVTNYGNAADGLADAASALNDAVIGHAPFATVAMDYRSSAVTNKVRFFTYDAQGQLLTAAALDSEGAKPTPGLCLACHGGFYNSSSNSVSGASFLPFDLEAFDFKPSGTYSKDNQQEEFRKMNRMVIDTNPGSSTTSLIYGWYGGLSGLNTVGKKQDPSYVPSGWSTEPVTYQKVVAPFCRTCHVAVGFPFDTFASFSGLGLKNAVCDGKYMPHAEVTRNSFWASSGRAHMVGSANIADACN